MGLLQAILQGVVEHPRDQQRFAQPRAAGKTSVLQIGKHIEALGAAGHGLRHEAAGQLGEHDAGTRETLNEKTRATQTSEVRQSIHGDRQ